MRQIRRWMSRKPLEIEAGTLQMQDKKMQDWKMRHQEKYGTLQVY